MTKFEDDAALLFRTADSLTQENGKPVPAAAAQLQFLSEQVDAVTEWVTGTGTGSMPAPSTGETELDVRLVQRATGLAKEIREFANESSEASRRFDLDGWLNPVKAGDSVLEGLAQDINALQAWADANELIIDTLTNLFADVSKIEASLRSIRDVANEPSLQNMTGRHKLRAELDDVRGYSKYTMLPDQKPKISRRLFRFDAEYLIDQYRTYDEFFCATETFKDTRQPLDQQLPSSDLHGEGTLDKGLKDLCADLARAR